MKHWRITKSANRLYRRFILYRLLYYNFKFRQQLPPALFSISQWSKTSFPYLVDTGCDPSLRTGERERGGLLLPRKEYAVVACDLAMHCFIVTRFVSEITWAAGPDSTQRKFLSERKCVKVKPGAHTHCGNTRVYVTLHFSDSHTYVHTQTCVYTYIIIETNERTP